MKHIRTYHCCRIFSKNDVTQIQFSFVVNSPTENIGLIGYESRLFDADVSFDFCSYAPSVPFIIVIAKTMDFEYARK